MLNPVPVSNLQGYVLLSIYNIILPANIALNLLVFSYFLGMAFSFRYLVISVAGKASPMVYSVFPFIMNNSLNLGLMNFCLGVALLLFMIGYWLRVHKEFKIIHVIVFGLLFLLMNFTHLLSFVFLGLLILIFLVYEQIQNIYIYKTPRLKQLFIKIIKLVIAVIPALLFALNYTLNVSGYVLNANKQAGDNMTILESLYYVRPLIIFHVNNNGNANLLLFFGILAIILIYIIYRIINRNSGKNKAFYSNLMMLVMIILLAMLILVPSTFLLNTMRLRISLIFFLFLMVWLNSVKMPWKIEVLAGLFFLFVFTEHQVRMSDVRTKISDASREVFTLEEHMDPNTVYLPVNAGNQWMNKQILNYVGAEKPIVNIKHPHAYRPFPVLWNWKKVPHTLFGGHRGDEIPIYYNPGRDYNKTQEIDYVLIYYPEIFDKKRKDEGYATFFSILDNKYVQTFESESKHLVLLKRIE
ncbi:MAG: hypothetical protein ABFS05_05555 [Bacteroidota bacterium]